jgi:hypothetical protein
VPALVALCAGFVAPTHAVADARPEALAVDVARLWRSSHRTVMVGDVAHYRFDLAVGPGRYDVIRIHRVVRESRPFRPRPADGAIVLLPGSANFFESIFIPPLISSVPARDRSVAVFLAQHDIDVWGIDYGWALVPAETTDFDFMRGWGVEKDTRHVETALSLIREVRQRTSQDSGRLDLLGYSYGGVIAYSIAGRETRRPRARRHVEGLIVADVPMAIEDPSVRAYYCGLAASDQARVAAGEYQDDSGSVANLLGGLAIAEPEGDSPIAPGFTNLQLALVFGAETWVLDGNPTFWHFVGGDLDAAGLAFDLRYTEPRLWLDLLQSLPAYMPRQQALDLDTMFCGTTDVPFDDRLGDIRVPLLYAGTGGGLGEAGYFTTTLTASDDVTLFTVRLQSEDLRMLDFGHGDLFLAGEARELAWRRILDWLVEHRSRS